MKLKLNPASLALLFAIILPAFAQIPEDQERRFDEAEQHIVRLPPSAFPELPPDVIRELERRGCRIPQDAFAKKPHNVIKGHFAKPGETDWAVLCSVKGVSTVLVFRNGSESNPASVAPMRDRNFLQGITKDQIGFSREIGAVGKDVILGHFHAYGGPKPPPIDHEGIDDAFLEKASSTWYFYGGRWLELSGSD